ncbi:MAG: hypothetical protein BWY79_01668 [Actinobacteria bacterium ADurb.Bin444]|nr:MAG: hypothetical protein BWY79_01668 [Actinobacteria bacterium ADurb.Bin444]
MSESESELVTIQITFRPEGDLNGHQLALALTHNSLLVARRVLRAGIRSREKRSEGAGQFSPARPTRQCIGAHRQQRASPSPAVPSPQQVSVHRGRAVRDDNDSHTDASQVVKVPSGAWQYGRRVSA